jgi:hypothetical protein
VRPLTNGKAGTYELVFGARRYRASRLAKRETIPAAVRELTDAEALELQVVKTCNARTFIHLTRHKDTPPSSNSSLTRHRAKHCFPSGQVTRIRQRIICLTTSVLC